ncbi:putative steryl acetyl hydrolase [Lyophyllum shimeji]|uniref:Steryl acetyl hydrolase n=1 Tax=Lyophyllum shimeji TaxID=47721 RepID=A0A9P3PHZ6_LYOSH|nr:putative steryl acetyl hydrolase [Lyophyllum shimeji]
MPCIFHWAGSTDPLTADLNEFDKGPSVDNLCHYATPGVTPPSARVNPKMKYQPRRPLKIWDYWRYGLVIISKASEITRDIFSHHIWGPRKKSWGIEMTLVSSVMRGAGRHTSLVDIATTRMLMSVGGLVPLPSDALVTPVSFRVKKRDLPGILAEFDAAEDGTRELAGEWVVGKKTWQRLQVEWKTTQGQSPADDKTMNENLKTKEQVILYIHGGAYYLSSAAAQRLISIPLSKFTDARVFALDYRLAPETRFPGPLHDVVSGYLRLVDDLQIPPENILLAGDSAGGGLCLALLMYLRDNKYSIPAGAILMSPWVDLTMSCDSWDSNANFDVVPFPGEDDHMNPIALYLGERMEDYLTHPYASPLFGNLQGLPPLLIQVGDAEVLRDEVTLFARKATLAGVDVRHELFEDAIHVFQTYPFLTATRRAFTSMKDFVQNILPQIRTRPPQHLNVRAEQKLESEIENERATVVRGDGVKTKSGMEGVNDTMGVEDKQDSQRQDDERGEYRSWKRSSRLWPLVHLPSPMEPDSEEPRAPRMENVAATQPPSPAVSSLPSTDTTEEGASLRRSRSAQFAAAPPRPPLIIRPHHHQSPALESRRPSPGHISLPPAPVLSHSPAEKKPSPSPPKPHSPAHSPIHSPSRSRFSVSHPDITSLVKNWAHTSLIN